VHCALFSPGLRPAFHGWNAWLIIALRSLTTFAALGGFTTRRTRTAICDPDAVLERTPEGRAGGSYSVRSASRRPVAYVSLADPRLRGPNVAHTPAAPPLRASLRRNPAFASGRFAVSGADASTAPPTIVIARGTVLRQSRAPRAALDCFRYARNDVRGPPQATSGFGVASPTRVRWLRSRWWNGSSCPVMIITVSSS
jgi:hypothetical protein